MARVRSRSQPTRGRHGVRFHHAQGLTPGVVAFADELRQAGHTVHTPDLFGGRTFETVAAGVGYAGELGFGEVLQRGVRAAEALPAELVYAGFLSRRPRRQFRPRCARKPVLGSCHDDH